MDTFLAALAGALVGGFASTYGALIVGKRARTRAERARIYADLLPKLMKFVPNRNWPGTTRAQLPPMKYRGVLEPIVRAGHVIGGEDADQVDKLHRILVEWGKPAEHRIETVNSETGAIDISFAYAGAEAEYDQLKQRIRWSGPGLLRVAPGPT